MSTGLLDPFVTGPSALREVQLAATSERLAQLRELIPALDRLADAAGIEAFESLSDMARCLFSHTTYKSYPDAYVDGRQWRRMSQWLATVSALDFTDVDVSSCADVDEWIESLGAAGYQVFVSGGTSGKSSMFYESADDLAFLADYQQNFMRFQFGVTEAATRYPCFFLFPRRGPYKAIYNYYNYARLYGDPGRIHYLSEGPLRVSRINAVGRLRRAMMDGRALPSDISSFEEEAEKDAAEAQAGLSRLIDELFTARHEPVFLAGTDPQIWRIVEEGRRRGIPDGDFHPESVFYTGGGTKGSTPPADYLQQIREFFGGPSSRYNTGYGFSELQSSIPPARSRGGRTFRPT